MREKKGSCGSTFLGELNDGSLGWIPSKERHQGRNEIQSRTAAAVIAVIAAAAAGVIIVVDAATKKSKFELEDRRAKLTRVMWRSV